MCKKICWILLLLLMFAPQVEVFAQQAGLSAYYVSPLGSDTNSGSQSQPLKTIQKAADLARAGTSVYVMSGSYAEHVKIQNGGSGEASRVVFRALGPVTMQGFHINSSFVSVEGFDITNYTVGYQGHITIGSAVDNCQILNNTVRDGLATIVGILFNSTSRNCLIKGNTVSNLKYVFVSLNGDNHRFEDNVLENLNMRDFVYLFGRNHYFVHNIFRKGNYLDNVSNHPDWIQTFADNNGTSNGHLFEENYIEGLEATQVGQVNNGGGFSNPILSSDIHSITFRRNVFANISNNFNGAMPGLKFDHNTFYRTAYDQSGLSFGATLTRGETSGASITNNALIAGGDPTRDNSGFYSLQRASMSEEAIAAFVTHETEAFVWPVAKAIYADMVTRGYMNSNGKLLSAGLAITDISQFTLSDEYLSYKNATYETLKKVIALDTKVRTSGFADYNFVAGLNSSGYTAKRSDNCTDGVFTSFRFCEEHGVNGGDPKLTSTEDLLGPDGKIFTADDGLKPKSGSVLCGKGMVATDIGAYSCDSAKVFSLSGTEGADKNRPVASILLPRAGENVAGNVIIQALASDPSVAGEVPSGIASVQFFVDGVAISPIIKNFPYSTVWNTATSNSGSHAIYVVVVDRAGNTTQSITTTVNLSSSKFPASPKNMRVVP